MKGKISAIGLALCMLSCILAACGNAPNGNESTPPAISGENVTASPGPDNNPTNNPTGSPSDDAASPSPDTDGASPSAETSNVYVGIVKSIDGNQIDLTSEGLDDVTAAGNDTKTKSITLDNSIPITKQGVSAEAKIGDIKQGDVLIVTMDAGKPVTIYDYGPLKD